MAIIVACRDDAKITLFTSSCCWCSSVSGGCPSIQRPREWLRVPISFVRSFVHLFFPTLFTAARPGDGAFDHKTGKGHVEFRKGEYHDALTVKRNEVCLLLHENLGGGFSPPAAHKIRRLGRKARSGIDRTPYKTDRKISFVSYHTRSISMNITRAEAWQLHKAVNTAKGNLCRHRDRSPTGGA